MINQSHLPSGFAGAALILCGFSTVAHAQQTTVQDGSALPDIAQALLDAAYQTGDPTEIEAVANAVKTVFPDYREPIESQTAAKVASLKPALADAADENTDDASSKKASAPEPASAFALSPWDGKISASGLRSTGNSENAAVGVAIDAARTARAFTHNITAYFDLGESNGVTNQRRWGGAYQLDYDFGDRTYVYGRVSYDEDQFSGFDYRLFGGGGLGHYFVQSKPFTWKVEGGPGYRYSPLQGSTEIDQNFAVYAASELDWTIREGVTLEQDFNTTWTSPTTTFQSVTALTTKIWGDISTGLSFEYRYETDPPAGRDNTDTIAKASLIYGF